MKILQVSPRYFPCYGGVEEHVKNISEGLSKNHEVVVCTTDPSGRLEKEEVIKGVEVKRFKSFAPSDSYYFSGDLKKYLHDNCHEFDVVHAHSYHAFPALYASRVEGDTAFVFSPHYHGHGHSRLRNFLHFPYKFYGKNIFGRADGVVCVSKYERDLVTRDFGFSDKILVIPNGVRKAEFEGFKKETKDYRLLLFVGRLEEYKGAQYVISALPRLSDETFLHIVGNGPFKKELERLAKKLNVADRVVFFENLPRNVLLKKYFEADLFILLSRHEAFGISVAEALSAKTPCILAETSALVEWIDNRNCFGISYPVQSDELAELVKGVIGKTVSHVDLLDWKDVTSRLDCFYKTLMEN